MGSYTNADIANMLRKMAAAYQILNENRFKIIAYDRAADSVEHLTSELKDLWSDKKLEDVPGIGPTIVGHIDELFRTGHVRHFETVMSKVPPSVFPLLSVPGIGPKKAYALVEKLHLTNEKTVISDIERAIKEHKIAPLEGFGEKSEEVIAQNIKTYKKGSIKEKRILLSEADTLANDIINYLKKHKSVERADVLGSLRRRVSTIGDIDISVITNKPEEAVSYFCLYPHQKLIEKGPTGVSLLLPSGRQVDLRVQDRASYGAMLQYFTGSKNHNIALRTYALTQGMSLSEYGIKIISNVKSQISKIQGKNQKDMITQFNTEEKFYHYLGMDWIPPELREDKGEIQAALEHKLPHLVEFSDIRGDLHLHTNYDLESSHDLGVNSLDEILDKAHELGYDYIGISDHNPSISKHTEGQVVSIMKKRQQYYLDQLEEWKKRKNHLMHIFIMLEVDIQPDGKLALPEQAFEYVDAVIVSVHSSFLMKKDEMTKRILKALNGHPKVKVLGHPTGRLLLGKREGIEADWKEIFHVCEEKKIALEINASPYRLDLPDGLVFDAVRMGCSFVINTDSHNVNDMDSIVYGVSVARRGWCEKHAICNTYSHHEIMKWLTGP